MLNLFYLLSHFSSKAEMKRFASADTSVLKLHYEKKVLYLEQEKKTLQKEIEQLRCNLSNISSTSDDSTQKLKENYLQKLTCLEAQDDIQRIKTQKVQLQQKIKQESEQFRLWKASREKEVLQLLSVVEEEKKEVAAKPVPEPEKTTEAASVKPPKAEECDEGEDEDGDLKGVL
ncbi:hypothetical protein POM88_043046 [Heracleum sosnowskyi]|uniref:Uncharacterized protein n=1 Tax=Heracleum sosnowskyi TaxID=360622 RepID=A0AAD8M9R6_9APIA|nr:hypothetical protein POM88_043046 [Heracleum sosnowskyi]